METLIELRFQGCHHGKGRCHRECSQSCSQDACMQDLPVKDLKGTFYRSFHISWGLSNQDLNQDQGDEDEKGCRIKGPIEAETIVEEATKERSYGKSGHSGCAVYSHRTSSCLSGARSCHDRHGCRDRQSDAGTLKNAQEQEICEPGGKGERERADPHQDQSRLDEGLSSAHEVAQGAYKRLKASIHEAIQGNEDTCPDRFGPRKPWSGQPGHVERDKDEKDTVPHRVRQTRRGKSQNNLIETEPGSQSSSFVIHRLTPGHVAKQGIGDSGSLFPKFSLEKQMKVVNGVNHVFRAGGA